MHLVLPSAAKQALASDPQDLLRALFYQVSDGRQHAVDVCCVANWGNIWNQIEERVVSFQSCSTVTGLHLVSFQRVADVFSLRCEFLQEYQGVAAPLR